MRILWINNIAIPKIAKNIGMETVPVGGWMVKLADEIAKNEDIQLGIAFPYKENVSGVVENIEYYGFTIDASKIKDKDLGGQDVRIHQIIKAFQPDMVHIFGTEYLHSFVVTQVCKKIGMEDKVVVSIQGLTSIYAKHYYAYMDFKTVYGRTLRDCYKGNVHAGKKWFENSGKYEIETIKAVKHVIGRTDWDKACTEIMNPQAKYHFNNEMLRDSFYDAPQWKLENCQKYSLFLSQATLPLKGLHLALEAVSILKKEFPELQVCIAGKSYYQKKRWKLSYYEKSVLKYIKDYKLEKTVSFSGFLDEEAMCQKYLKSHVFVSASSIENSPNSLCEAMILGVPAVSSLVGGVVNLLEHGKEGFYYQADAPYMLAHYIKKIFNDDALAKNISDNARATALKRHDVEKIISELLGIYKEICA